MFSSSIDSPLHEFWTFAIKQGTCYSTFRDIAIWKTSKTAFPTVTKEPLGAKFEFQISKMVVCASNAPKLYSKQLVSYTSKHRKHHNTPNIAKNTKTPYIRPETSKTAFLTVTRAVMGQIWISNFKNGCMCLQCTETILKITCIIHKQAQETPQHPKHQKQENPLYKRLRRHLRPLQKSR